MLSILLISFVVLQRVVNSRLFKQTLFCSFSLAHLLVHPCSRLLVNSYIHWQYFFINVSISDIFINDCRIVFQVMVILVTP